MLTAFKSNPSNKWLKEISGRALKISVLNAVKAYENFFNGKSSYPKFKSKKNSIMSCSTHEKTTLIEKSRIRCEKIGWIKSHKHNIPIGKDIKYINPKITFDGIDYWFSVSVEIDSINNNKEKTEAIGIDLGIKKLAVCSNGIELSLPNIKNEKNKLKKLQRKVSKHYIKMKLSSNRTRAKFNTLQKSKNLIKLEYKILKQHKRITNKLNTNIHMFTKKIINLNPECIVIEDLSVNNMIKNIYISEKIKYSKFYEFRRQFEYKCRFYNVKLIIADRWYASSKICSNCGTKKKYLSLSDRIYTCEMCGLVLDRDLNASINLKSLSCN